jgi:hypothetical protein
MNVKKEKLSRKARVIRPVVVIAFVIAMMVGYATLPRPVLEQDDEKTWHVIFEGNMASAAEANPGAGVGGILEIFFVNHTDEDCSENDSATIEGWCDAADLGYASADDFNVELANSVAFDIIVRVRGNVTMCDRGGDWFPADLKVEITSADLGLGADTAMTGTVTLNNTALDYLYMNFEHDNADAGFTLSKDEVNQITSIKFSAYY